MDESRQYELLFIVRPDLSEEEINRAVSQVQAYMESNGCLVKRLDRWGMRKLAYEVKKFHEGYYVLMIFDSDPQFIEPFKRWLVLNEAVIRHLVVRSDADPEKSIKVPPEVVGRYEETHRAEPRTDVTTGEAGSVSKERKSEENSQGE
ncbi:TPA: 30S ribosomal protein S6 [Candidatus Poribacteria bacterium]|nr:30S ribosomal protein S6 [Candidatus Poribacteria bacterium]